MERRRPQVAGWCDGQMGHSSGILIWWPLGEEDLKWALQPERKSIAFLKKQTIFKPSFMFTQTLVRLSGSNTSKLYIFCSKFQRALATIFWQLWVFLFLNPWSIVHVNIIVYYPNRQFWAYHPSHAVPKLCEIIRLII